MRRTLGLLALALLWSCSGTQQADAGVYSYPGCDSASGGACPYEGRLDCAIETLQAQSNHCQQDSDCVGVPIDGCTGNYLCPPPAVNVSQRTAFEDAAVAELTRFCASTTCRHAPSCAPSFSQGLARCDLDAGTCVALPNDGG